MSSIAKLPSQEVTPCVTKLRTEKEKLKKNNVNSLVMIDVVVKDIYTSRFFRDLEMPKGRVFHYIIQIFHIGFLSNWVLFHYNRNINFSAISTYRRSIVSFNIDLHAIFIGTIDNFCIRCYISLLFLPKHVLLDYSAISTYWRSHLPTGGTIAKIYARHISYIFYLKTQVITIFLYRLAISDIVANF